MRDAPPGQEGKWAVIRTEGKDKGEEAWRWPVDCREMIAIGGWEYAEGFGPSNSNGNPVPHDKGPSEHSDGVPLVATSEGSEAEVAEKPKRKAPKPRKRRAPRTPRKPKAAE